MTMIPLGASSCAHKTISWSTEWWRIFVKTWLYLCVHFCHGKYMKVHETAIFHFTCSVCYIKLKFTTKLFLDEVWELIITTKVTSIRMFISSMSCRDMKSDGLSFALYVTKESGWGVV